MDCYTWLFRLWGCIRLTNLKWYFCFRKVRLNSMPNHGPFNFISNVQKRPSTKNHQEKSISQLYRSVQIKSSLISIFPPNPHLRHMCHMQPPTGASRIKVIPRILPWTLWTLIKYIFQEKQYETAHSRLLGSVFRSVNYTSQLRVLSEVRNV